MAPRPKASFACACGRARSVALLASILSRSLLPLLHAVRDPEGRAGSQFFSTSTLELSHIVRIRIGSLSLSPSLPLCAEN